ncbi:exonuclease, partial [Stenotrophomonas maltophilia]
RPRLRRPEVGSLHRLLGLRTRGGPAPARASAQDRQLPGEEIAPGLFLIESLQPQAIPAQPLSLDFARRDGEHVAARDLLFFDTETTGLAGGTGTRAFMIGAADWHVCPQRGEGLRIRQLLMATMAAEDAMLATFARWLQPSTVFCSYNGRSYDAPLLKARYRLARQPDPITALDHVDLLYPTRRRYRGSWENCKLSTIERQLLRVVREDDLPGSEAPGAWLRFLRGGDAVNLRRVADHNHQDVVTLALLLQRLVREEQRERETLALVGQ